MAFILRFRKPGIALCAPMPAYRILSLHHQLISAIARQIIATFETMRLKYHCLRIIGPSDASGPLSGYLAHVLLLLFAWFIGPRLESKTTAELKQATMFAA